MLHAKKLLTKMLADTGWRTIGNNGVSYRIYRGVCYIVIENANLTTSWSTIATLPAEACPQAVINPYLHRGFAMAQCFINTSGAIKAQGQVADSGYSGFCAFPVE